MNTSHLDKIIREALDEDLQSGDITSELLIKEGATAKANIIAKEDFVLSGATVASRVFEILGANVAFKAFFKDGAHIKTGETIIALTGDLRAILAGERVALNFLQHLSGIATLTSQFAIAVKDFGVKIMDTRKTTPTLRFLEKAAVLDGGGYNHRMGLYDMVLIKDNHVKFCGGVYNAVTTAKNKAANGIKIEVETTNLDEVKEALDAGADIIMFDNMTPELVKKGVEMVGGKALTEVSGGITLKNIAEYAKHKPSFISIGALTHSAKAVDISLLIE